MASAKVETEVLAHVMTCYDMKKADAYEIYKETHTLYHQLPTSADLGFLQTIDKKFLSSLMVMITESIELKDLNQFYISVVFYIIFYCDSDNSQYVFTQWIGLLCQESNVTDGIKMLILILEELHAYILKSNLKSLTLFYNIFKSFNNNITMLEKKTNEPDRQKQRRDVKHIRSKFDLFAAEIKMAFSDDSDESDNEANPVRNKTY